MVIPPAEAIEGAVDDMRSVDTKILQDQKRELYSATGNSNEVFSDGYNLGLQVARRMIASNVAVQAVGLKANYIL